MCPKPRISLERQGMVVALSREGYTQREIAGKVDAVKEASATY